MNNKTAATKETTKRAMAEAAVWRLSCCASLPQSKSSAFFLLLSSGVCARPSQAEPSQAKPSQAKPSQAKPSQAKPSEKTSFCFGASPLHIFFQKVVIFIYDVAFSIFFRTTFDFQKNAKRDSVNEKRHFFKRKYEEAKRQNKNQKPSQAKTPLP